MNTPPAATPPGAEAGAETDAFAPLRHRAFAVLWAAAVLGNIGSFMRDVASGWLVTELSSQPAVVAAVQAAATLPIFLLALPAGVLSDIFDRRRLLIGVQLLLAAVSATLMLMAHTGTLGVASLLALSFVGGVGAALMGPAWQSIVPELVPRAQLRGAVALNSLGINIARAIGPAAGGALLAAVGAAFTYGLDLLSYGLVLAALLWWRRPAPPDKGLAEQFGGAFRAGLRYTLASRDMHRVLLRAAVFFGGASAIWALLPLVARQLLQGGASLYGLMLGAVGLGAIGGALALPWLRRRLSADGLLAGAAATVAAVMAALVPGPPAALALAWLALLGAGWIVALTTLAGTAQAVLPNWVRGRGLAVYLMVFNGALTGGSLGWGLLAGALGVAGALLVAAAGLAASALLMRRWPLPAGEDDLTPARHWPEPGLTGPEHHDRGPVLVQVSYRVHEADRGAFLQALQALSWARRRDGAYAWGVCEDTNDPECLVEWFFVASWAEHRRQHERVSQADAALQAAVARWHAGPERPAVRHYLGLPVG